MREHVEILQVCKLLFPGCSSWVLHSGCQAAISQEIFGQFSATGISPPVRKGKIWYQEVSYGYTQLWPVSIPGYDEDLRLLTGENENFLNFKDKTSLRQT